MDENTTEKKPFQRILVGVDGTEQSILALRWAIDLAVVTGSTVTAVMGWLPNVNYAYPDVPFVKEAAQQAFAEAIEAVDARGVDVQVVFAQREAAGLLTESSAGADLLVLGARRHHGLVGLVLGSVSAQVLPHAHCPVVVVPDTSAAPATAPATGVPEPVTT